MAYSNRYNNSQSYAPSAPSFPGEQSPYTSAAAAPNYYAHHSQSYPHGTTTTSSSNSAYGSYGQQYPPSSSSSEFPAGTHPDVIRSFQMVDRTGVVLLMRMSCSKLFLLPTSGSLLGPFGCSSFSSRIPMLL